MSVVSRTGAHQVATVIYEGWSLVGRNTRVTQCQRLNTHLPSLNTASGSVNQTIPCQVVHGAGAFTPSIIVAVFCHCSVGRHVAQCIRASTQADTLGQQTLLYHLWDTLFHSTPPDGQCQMGQSHVPGNNHAVWFLMSSTTAPSIPSQWPTHSPVAGPQHANGWFPMDLLIVGGINRLLYNPTWHTVPRHGSRETLIENTLAAMRLMVETIRAGTAMPVVLATLPGIDLAAYSPEYHNLLSLLQSLVDDVVMSVNLRIRGINRLNNLRTLNLAYPVHRCKGKCGKYRSQYSLLHEVFIPTCKIDGLMQLLSIALSPSQVSIMCKIGHFLKCCIAPENELT